MNSYPWYWHQLGIRCKKFQTNYDTQYIHTTYMCQAPTSGSKRGLLHRNPFIQYLTASHEKIKSENKSTEAAIRVSVILLLSVCIRPYFKWKFKSVLRTYKEEICPSAVTPDTDSYAFIFVFKISIVFLSWHALQPWTHSSLCWCNLEPTLILGSASKRSMEWN